MANAQTQIGRTRTIPRPEQIGLAEQFDDMPQQIEASTLGMWTFLATEILFFGALFLSYIVYRHTYFQAFAEAGRHTKILHGSINTALLLTSSLTKGRNSSSSVLIAVSSSCS